MQRVKSKIKISTMFGGIQRIFTRAPGQNLSGMDKKAFAVLKSNLEECTDAKVTYPDANANFFFAEVVSTVIILLFK